MSAVRLVGMCYRGVGELIMSHNGVTSTGESLLIPCRMKLHGRRREQMNRN